MYLVAVAYHLPRDDLCCWHIGNWLYSKFGVSYADTVIDAVANKVMPGGLRSAPPPSAQSTPASARGH
jgi:hypothetical protein